MSGRNSFVARIRESRGRPWTYAEAEGNGNLRCPPHKPLADGERRVVIEFGPHQYDNYSVTLVDGDERTELGSISKSSVNFDRRPRGSRIATSRTTSDRWFPRGQGHGSWGWDDTRIDAALSLLRAHLNRDRT